MIGMNTADVAIIGGGIVGLATAWNVARAYPGKKLLVLEKERQLGQHQTGHNSGVLHSGIYYKPGSLKALTCRAGRQAMAAFCAEHAIPLEICGKVIVATSEDELPRLQTLFERGQANGVDCVLIGPERLRELEPFATSGIQAIHVPEVGIVDYGRVCARLAELLTAQGHQILTRAQVRKFRRDADALVLESTAGPVRARYAINCGGLHSDRLARLSGQDPHCTIVPFRGEYYELKPAAAHYCRNIIYPVPDPAFPFLGVHFTRHLDGSRECGPNAVLALAREGYTWGRINLRDLGEMLCCSALWKVVARHWKMGAGEVWRSLSKAAFVKALQRLLPVIRSHDLAPAPAGFRAQSLSDDGQLVDDFLIVESERVINVCNAPSPGATASLRIGQLIAEKLGTRLPYSPRPPLRGERGWG
jgi:L-2-hydroxyglutarate oxidase